LALVWDKKNPTAPVPEDWDAFVAAQERDREGQIARFDTVAALVVNVTILPVLPALGALNYASPLVSVANIVTIAVVWLLYWAKVLDAQGIKRFVVAYYWWGALYNSALLVRVIEATTSKEARLISFAEMMMFNSLAVLTMPSLRTWWRFALGAYLIQAAACLYADRVLLTEFVLFCVTAAVIGIRFLANRASDTGIRFAYELARRTRIEEQSRQDMALELARRLQRSVLPEPKTVAGPLTVSTFQKMYFAVGGDWIAVRRLEGDCIAVVLADATGKGFEAALVIHAIQSLWISSLGRPFDAEAWITMVHETLLALGKNEPHTASIGIVEVSPERLTYWSAGHVPGYFVSDAAPDSPRLVAARGSIPGLAATFTVGKAVVELPAEHGVRAVFGTDGVLARDGVHGAPARLKFAKDLAMRGSAALDGVNVDDDRSVVLIERGPLTGRRERAA
jgi:hypothetical protein